MERSTDREIREKLVSRGVESLSDAELISIILGDGGEYSAIETATRILDANGSSLLTLSRADMPRLRMTEGIGMRRAAVLTAAFELAVRLRNQEAAAPSVIRTKDDVAEIFAPQLSRLKHEEMWALYLTSANSVIEKRRISQGGVTSLTVDYKLVVKRAIELLSPAMIIVHNHPSGIASPSPEDIALTARITEAAALFDILLVDHIIIADNASYSFRQHGHIQ